MHHPRQVQSQRLRRSRPQFSGPDRQSTTTVDDAVTRLHRPLQTRPVANVAAAMKTVSKQPPRLPGETVTWPTRPVPYIAQAMAQAQDAQKAFGEGDHDIGSKLYDNGFACWPEGAEMDAAHATDAISRGLPAGRPSRNRYKGRPCQLPRPKPSRGPARFCVASCKAHSTCRRSRSDWQPIGTKPTTLGH